MSSAPPPHPDRWQLWVQDRFDPDAPRRIEASGAGLREGLSELWKHHLQESVRPDGQEGFMRFNLWLVEDEVSVQIHGPWEGQLRLRGWLIEEPTKTTTLLSSISCIHRHLLLKGETSAELLDAVLNYSTLPLFILWMDTYIQQQNI